MISFNISEKNAIKNSVKLLLMALFLLAGTIAYGQSLVEKLGGTTTDFIIETDYLTFEVESQAIIKRGINNVRTSGYKDEYGYGYGYGLQTWHLEFTTSGKIVEYYKKTKEVRSILLEVTDQDNRKLLSREFATPSDVKFYDVQLTGEGDKVLLKIRLSESEVKSVSNGEGLYTYSINLKKIPIIVLDKTKRIHIISTRNYKKK